MNYGGAKQLKNIVQWNSTNWKKEEKVIIFYDSALKFDYKCYTNS